MSKMSNTMDTANVATLVDLPNVSQLVAATLEKIIDENYRRQLSTPLRMNKDDCFAKFQSSYAPEISIASYIDSIHMYSKCSDSSLILMLIYIDRLIEKKALVLTRLNAHRVIVTSLVVAAKFHDDFFYNNAYFAKLGGVPLQELNLLEADFLQLQEFSMFVHTSVFDKYYAQLRNCQHLVPTAPMSPVTVTYSSYGGSPVSPMNVVYVAPSPYMASSYTTYPASVTPVSYTQQSQSRPFLGQSAPVLVVVPSETSCVSVPAPPSSFVFPPILYTPTYSQQQSHQHRQHSPHLFSYPCSPEYTVSASFPPAYGYESYMPSCRVQHYPMQYHSQHLLSVGY